MPSGASQYRVGDVGPGAVVLQGEHLSAGLDEEKLVAVLEARGHVQTAELAGLQRRVIIGLARSLKREVSDFDQAVAELERAVEVALEVIARGERGTNTDELVDKVLSQIAEKTRREDFDGGARAVDDALAELDRREAEERDAGRRARVALLEAGVRQDTLRRDAVAVAGRIAALVAVPQPTDRPAWLPEFRKHWDAYYEDGDAKGINFSLSVAIELARLMLATAGDDAERGIAANLLGNALSTLGAAGERDGAAGGGGRGLPRGAGGGTPRSGAARLGDDAEQPRQRAFDTRGTGERDGASGGGGRGLPRGAGGVDPRSGAARVGGDAEQPRQRASGTRGTGERDGASGGGGRGLPRGAGGEDPRSGAARLGDDAEQPRHRAFERSGSGRAGRRVWRRRSRPTARRWRSGRAIGCRSTGR